MKRILISACLLGRPVRYDGAGKALGDARLDRWSAEGRLVPVCPELLGGLAVPRPSAEIEGGASGADVLAGRARIVTGDGADVTAAFRAGAEAALAIARREGCVLALLTDGSPSCGRNSIYSGAFDGVRHQGMGVFAALLEASGVEVFAEAGIDGLAARLVEDGDARHCVG